MLYIGYWIIVNGQNIKKKTVPETPMFELPRAVLSNPAIACPPPPPPAALPCVA